MSDDKLTIRRLPGASWFDISSPAGFTAVSVYTANLGFDLDPERLRDWIESERPKPLYTVEYEKEDGTWLVVKSDDTVIAACDRRSDAEQIAWALNAQEAKS